MRQVEVDIDKDAYLECYHHLLDENDIDIEILFGARDSGKSKFIAQYFTEQSMMLDYFRCLLIKETHESIKDAQWQMLKDVAEEWQVDHLFNFQTSPLGIKVQNGNTFATRGMDKPGKIRSFSNPSHAWVEEGNQISETSFITLLTGLRNDNGPVKLFLSLNPEANTPDFQDFWLYKMFFANYRGEKIYVGRITTPVKVVRGGKVVEMEVTLKFRITHTTYHDNPYVTPQRIAFHEALQHTNPYWYRVFTLGLWGNQENDMPWAFAFNRQKHVGTVVVNPSQILYLAFDFNRNPAACLVLQWYDDQVRVLESIKLPKSGTDALCDYILLHYPGYLYMITGDYSGNTPSSLYEEEVTNYLIIKHKLNLTDGQINVIPNPPLEHNQTHVNIILHYYNVIISEENAKGLTFDMENVRKTPEGKIEKKNRKDPAQQADILDCFRYFCNTFLSWFKPPTG